MTAPYMPLFIAEYLADTAHLSTVEHGAYLLLIMNYWQRQKPLPADQRKLARIARVSDEEWHGISETLAEFFREEDGEWRHKRIDAEMAIVGSKIEKARAAGKASVAARRASAEQSFNERSTDVEPLGKVREEEIKEDTSLRSVSKKIENSGETRLEAAGVSKSTLADWKSVRKAKKAGPITETVAKSIISEAKSCGMTPQEAVSVSTANGWQGFRAEWVNRQAKTGPPRHSGLTGHAALAVELERLNQWPN